MSRNKVLQTLRQQSRQTHQLAQARPQGAPATERGSAVVLEAAAYGSGSRATVRLLGSGAQASGVCHGARLTRGQVVAWQARPGGALELLPSVAPVDTVSTAGGAGTLVPHGHNGLSDGGYLGGAVSGGL